MKALLIVDVQEGLTKKNELFNDSLFIDTVVYAVNKCREKGQLVVFIQHNNEQLLNGTNDWEIDKRITKQEGDVKLQKQLGNAFEETNLRSILVNKGINEIIVCGLVTHGCVKSTCIGGLQEGFKVSILRNGHTNWSSDAEDRITSVEYELAHLGVNMIDKQEL
jgi:nicotinamidase-related amidase